jgi:two-component system, NtrC family, response regulator HydG
MTALVILVVDDHIHLAENIAEILEGQGYLTRVAASAEEALNAFEVEPIDALITDYRLPGLNGAQLIGEIRRRGRSIPALVMSAYSDDDTIREARDSGAIEVLGKPVHLPKLLGLLQTVREGTA